MGNKHRLFDGAQLGLDRINHLPELLETLRGGAEQPRLLTVAGHERLDHRRADTLILDAIRLMLDKAILLARRSPDQRTQKNPRPGQGKTIIPEGRRKTERACQIRIFCRQMQTQHRAHREAAGKNRVTFGLQAVIGGIHRGQPVLPAGGQQIGLCAAMSGQLAAIYGETRLIEPARGHTHFNRRAAKTVNKQDAHRPALEHDGAVNHRCDIG